MRLKTGETTYSGSNYISDANFFEIFLDTNKTINIVLKSNNSSEFTTLSGAIQGLSGKTVTLWIATNNGYFETDLNE